MKLIKKWWLRHFSPSENTLAGSSNSQDASNFYSNYFSLIAIGARLKLVEAMFDLNLFALFQKQSILFEEDIIQELNLIPIRGKKWLYLLSCEQFLIKIRQRNRTAYRLPSAFLGLIKGDQGSAMQFFFSTWKIAAEENLSEVLRDGKAKISVSWPPKTDTEVNWLENWMASTASPPLKTIRECFSFAGIKSIMDVGGGDGTMACALAEDNPQLSITVYNLPKSAHLARKNITKKNLQDRIFVQEGDFIAEKQFPKGFDLFLFSRVLFDWNEKVCWKLLTMAYQALPKEGLILICEFFKEESHDRCLANEYRYIFHDEFMPGVMKYAAQYHSMLRKIGFRILSTKKPLDSDFSLILAQK